MLLSVKQTVPPIVEPITLAQLKQHLRIDTGFTDDDALLGVIITAVRQFAENYTHRAFFNQTIVRTMDHFPANYYVSATINPSLRRDWPYYAGLWWNLTIALPVARLLAVESVTYLDQTGNTQTYPLDSLYIDYNSEPARIAPPANGQWPFTEFYVPGSVAITYEAGSFVSSEQETVTIPSTSPYTYTPLESPVTAITSVVDGSGNAVSYSYSTSTGNLTFQASNAGNVVTLSYYAGDMPATLIQAMLLLAAQWYEHREATTIGNLTEPPFAVTALLDQYVVNVLDYDSVV